MNDDETMDRRREKWHIGKEVPLTLIFALVLQAAGWIWFSAQQTAKLDYLADMMKDFRSLQYTQNDARRDMEITYARHLENRRRIEAVELAMKSGRRN